jgi:Transposase IS4
MNMDKRNIRGSYKMAVCKDLGIAAFQWVDSRVVSCVSTYLDFTVTEVHRQVGSSRQAFLCPSALVHYQRHMGGVDRSDQMRSHFGGFATQSHFKKWYKKTLMAVLDCMLLNGLHLWNLSAAKHAGRATLSRSAFIHAVAVELLHYETESLVSPTKEAVSGKERKSPDDGSIIEGGLIADGDKDNDKADNAEGADHRHSVILAATSSQKRCVVCQLEHGQVRWLLAVWGKKSKSSVASEEEKNEYVAAVHRAEAKLQESYKGVRKRVFECNCSERCKAVGLHQHMMTTDREQKYIHKIFPGKTCAEIYHSTVGKEIWKGKGNQRVSKNMNHPILEQIRGMVQQSLFEEDLNN